MMLHMMICRFNEIPEKKQYSKNKRNKKTIIDRISTSFGNPY